MKFTAPSSRAESGGTTTSSALDQTETNTGPAGVSSRALSRRSRSLSGTSWRQAVGHRPARPSASSATDGAVLRRPDAEHPSRAARPVVVADPLPGHHAARGVADHVDRGGTEAPHRRVRLLAERPRLRRDVAGARRRRAARRRRRARRPPARSRSGSSDRVEPPYPLTRSTGPGSSWATGTTPPAVARTTSTTATTATSSVAASATTSTSRRRVGDRESSTPSVLRVSGRRRGVRRGPRPPRAG